MKRYLSVLLAVALIAAMLAGCGAAQADNGQASAAASSVQEEPAAAAPEEPQAADSAAEEPETLQETSEVEPEPEPEPEEIAYFPLEETKSFNYWFVYPPFFEGFAEGPQDYLMYTEAEERLNEQIAERPDVEFAIVLLDVNDLKRVNDTAGHQAGDQYIKDACKIICDTFKHSPVFRIGGDEFAVIVQGSDYACIDDLVEKVNEQNEDALKNGGIVIACGMAKYENDEIAAPVLERADRNMYENKSILKSKS